MKTFVERAQAEALVGTTLARNVGLAEAAHANGVFQVVCLAPNPSFLQEFIALRDRIRQGGPIEVLQKLLRDLKRIPQETKWRDLFKNTVVTEGKNAALTHFLKGSAYTASQTMGLIEDTGYSAISATNTAANITAAGGGSPANGWNEAQSSTCASRGTPSFGTASAGSLATSAAVAFSMLATDTIKGAFLLCRSVAGTAPSATVGNTSGALYSAGLFSGGDRAVINGDTVNVSYTASL